MNSFCAAWQMVILIESAGHCDPDQLDPSHAVLTDEAEHRLLHKQLQRLLSDRRKLLFAQ